MAIYNVRGPDGQVHQFNGPDGAKPEDVEAAAAEHFGNGQTAPASPPGGEQPNEPDVGAQGALMSGFAHGASFGALPQHGAELHPIAAAAGNIIGSIVSGEAEARVGVAAAKAIAPQAVAKVGNVLALKSGQAVRNLLRLSGIGALSAGAQGGTSGAVEGAVNAPGHDDGSAPTVADRVGASVAGAGTGAAAGAVGGAVLAPVPAAGMKLVTAGRDMLADASTRALQVLAKKLDMPVGQLTGLMTDFKAATGKNATIADVLDAKSRANIKDDVQAFQSSHADMLEAAANNEEALPGNVQGQLKNLGQTQLPETKSLTPQGKVQTDPAQTVSTEHLNRLVNARKVTGDAAMKPIATVPVQFDVRHADLLSDPSVRKVARSIPSPFSGGTTLAEKLGDAADAVTPPTPAPQPPGASNIVGLPAPKAAPAAPKVNPATLRSTDDLTLRDVETLRRGLSEAATAAHERGNTQAGINLQNRADEIAAVGRNQIQEYGDMLDEWASHSRFISGFQHAANGGDASAGNVINPALHADLQSPEGQAGLELGARTKMVDNAATESGARSVINKARQVTGANKNLPVSEQNNQREMAQAHTTSQESHADLSGGTIKSKESETQSKLKTAGEAGFAALGVHATTGFKVHAIGRYLLGAGVRESTAKAIVEQLTTARTPQQIQSLHSTISGLNLTASQRRTVLANITRVAGRPAGQAAADYENAGAQ